MKYKLQTLSIKLLDVKKTHFGISPYYGHSYLVVIISSRNVMITDYSF